MELFADIPYADAMRRFPCSTKSVNYPVFFLFNLFIIPINDILKRSFITIEK
jgi:hypothetical protein